MSVELHGCEVTV